MLRVKLGSKAGKAASRITAEGVVAAAVDGDDRRAGRSQLRNRLRHQERQLPGLRQGAAPNWSPRTTRPTWPRCRRCRCAQDGFGPTRRRRAQGPDRQDRREHVDPPLQALRRRRQAGQLPARHAHRRGGRVRRRRSRRQGRGDARGGDEAGGAVQRRRACRTGRQGALGRRRQGRRRCRRRPRPPASRCSRPKSWPSASKARCRST